MDAADGTQSPLFRAAALAAERRAGEGTIVLAAPPSLTLTTLAIAAAASALVGLAYWGTYTAHASLPGELVPDLGLVDVRAPRAATILEKRVAEGRTVAAGQVLYVLSSARSRAGLPAAEASANTELERREQSLLQQSDRARELAARERSTLDQRIAALAADREHLVAMLAIAHERVDLATAAERRYASLAAAGLVSREALDAKEAERVAQRAALEQLEREDASVARELAAQQVERETLPLKHQNAAAEIARALAVVRIEQIENEVRERVAVVAPRGGTLTATMAELGQVVSAGEVLASIVPSGARLEAHLYAPSAAVGFVKAGDSVRLRYAAFPYQQHGDRRGYVRSVSGSALPPLEFGAGGVYRVTVELPEQSIAVDGERYPLRAGMQVEGEVMRDTRRLYEWALEPLRLRRAAP